MQAMIWTGTGLTLLGLLGLGYCVIRVLRARRSGLDDATMRAELRRVVTLNLASLGLSALGLLVVVTGIALG